MENILPQSVHLKAFSWEPQPEEYKHISSLTPLMQALLHQSEAALTCALCSKGYSLVKLTQLYACLHESQDIHSFPVFASLVQLIRIQLAAESETVANTSHAPCHTCRLHMLLRLLGNDSGTTLAQCRQ